MPQYLTPESIQELRDNLTMLDVYRARKASDKTEVGLQAYHFGAVRLGMIPEGTSLEDFLSQMRTEDFNSILGEERTARTPLAIPLNGGEIGPDSSSTTDTPQPSS